MSVLFTQSIVDAICERLADGESLRSICRDPLMPCKASVFNKLVKDKEFLLRYNLAREAQADSLVDDMLGIADDATNDYAVDPETGLKRVDKDHITRSRLRVDTRKWIAAKMKPKKYGDRQTIELDDITPKTPEQVEARLSQLLGIAQGFDDLI